MLEKRVILVLVYCGLLFGGSLVNAQSQQRPSAQQIEQFKKLPPQQQRVLAQQLGVDYAQIQQYIGGAGNSQQQSITNQTTVYPRGTEFDELGNPLTFSNPIDRFLEIQQTDLKPFGYELFAGSPSTFAPTFDTPVPANYLLGIGDTLEIQFYGKESASHTLQVNREGMLNIPAIKPLKVAGLTFTEAKAFISSQIKQLMLGVDSHVSMGQLRSMRIFVLGEAFKPGAYTVSSLTTMTQALFLSGGVNEIASLRNIQLKRAGKVISSLDLYDLLNKGDTSGDSLLQPGDVVFIPTVQNTVTIKGNVRRPAIYELKGDMTFDDAIMLAGGFDSNAYQGAINVQRITKGAISQLTIASDERHEAVNNGDVLDVKGVSDSIDSAVTLVGAVARPGPVQWFEGVRLNNLISDRKKDFLAEADLDYGLVLRNYQTGDDLKILQFQPLRLLAGVPEHNLELQKEDIIVIFSKVETETLGYTDIEQLAYSKQKLEEKDKEAWKKRIEQRLFYQQIGFSYDGSDLEDGLDDDSQLDKHDPLIRLTQLEIESLDKYRDSTVYSRARLLAPIIDKLSVHASFANPLKIVEISGSVQFPGLYPLPDNGTLKDIFLAAGGLSESAYSHQSELTRYSHNQIGDLNVENIQFKPADVVSGAKTLVLKSRDRINVYRNPEWQEQLQVEIQGEVAFPGKYTIRRGETLASVVERAGGLTKFADPNASIFLRKSLKRQERENLQRLTEDLRKEMASEGLRSNNGAGSIVSYSEVQKLLRDLTKVKAVGRLVIDLSNILMSAEKDFPLENEDVLLVPGQNKTINVIGEVYVPTSHLFEESMTFDQYIELSGGFKTFADDKRTYIIKANGSVIIPQRSDSFWYQSDTTNIVSVDPGDTIVVPFDSSHVDNLTLWNSASQIAYQLAVTVAAIGSL